MNQPTHYLKKTRTDAEVAQQDLAFLLNINTSNLARYENYQRSPTPEILLMYHILFGIPIGELLSPLYKTVKKNLIERSQLLRAQPNAKHMPKSKHSISYIEAIVNNLIQSPTHDC